MGASTSTAQLPEAYRVAGRLLDQEDVALRDVLRLPQPYIPPADIPDVKKEEIKPIVNAFLQHHLGPASGGAMIKFKRSDILGEAELVEAEVRGNISSSHRHALETTFLSTHDENVPVSDEIQGQTRLLTFFSLFLSVLAPYFTGKHLQVSLLS